jgi:hypothetical protein
MKKSIFTISALSLILMIVFGFTPTATPTPAPTSYNLPPADECPVIEDLPDPFRKYDNTRVQNRSEWESQRHYLKAMLQEYFYGYFPEGPFNVTGREVSSESYFGGKAVRKVIEIKCGPIGEEITFRAGLIKPQGPGPFPVVVRNDRGNFISDNHSETGIDRGYIMMAFDRTVLDEDRNGSVGQVQQTYADVNFPTLAVWAWGHMRLVDWLETVDYADATKVVVTGHSRGGKTALLAAAFDERIAIGAPSGSGDGGMCPMRFTYLNKNKSIRHWMEIPEGREWGLRTYWFTENFSNFMDKETSLPVDANTLISLVAPRGMISLDGLKDGGAMPLGEAQGSYAAQPVYDWLGASKNIAINFHDGGHEQNAESYDRMFQFADWYFFKKQPTHDLYDRHFPQEPDLMSWEPPDGN